MSRLYDTSVYDADGQLHEVTVEFDIEPRRRATETDPPEGGVIIDNIESIDGYVLTAIPIQRITDDVVRNYCEVAQ